MARDGGGYWEVAADGSVYAFADAHFFGAAVGSHPSKPVVSLMGDR